LKEKKRKIRMRNKKGGVRIEKEREY